MRTDRTGRFARLYQGCRVPGCDRPHRSKGFYRGHLSAFERGRIDSRGSLVLNQCEFCLARYVAGRADRRFCPECVLRRARKRAQRRRKRLRGLRPCPLQAESLSVDSALAGSAASASSRENATSHEHAWRAHSRAGPSIPPLPPQAERCVRSYAHLRRPWLLERNRMAGERWAQPALAASLRGAQTI